MKNLYRFNEFLSEADTIGDFAKKFTDRMDTVEKIANEARKKLEEEKKDVTFEFKDKPLKKDDERKEWVKKIQDVFVDKKFQEKISSGASGSFGDKTKEAVNKYQKSKGLEETGEVDNELMKLILKDLEEIQAKKKEDTPFKDKTEGNAFRKWMKEKYPDFKDGKEPLAEDGDYNNSTIQQAYKKHGEEYKKDKK